MNSNAINCRKDRAKGVEILVKDLKVFAAFNEDLFKEITQLLTLENFRYGLTLGGNVVLLRGIDCVMNCDLISVEYCRGLVMQFV